MRSGKKDILGRLDADIIDTIINNQMLNAFRIAINKSSGPPFNMVDGIVDEFEDETGVDTVNSVNESYDSTNDIYSPQGAGVDASTKLMIHGNDGDTSGQKHSMTYSADAKIDASTYKWGIGALILDGTGDFISESASADWDIFANNTDSWTVDLWVKHTDHVGSENYIMIWDGSTAERGIQLVHVHGLGILVQVYKAGTGNIISLSGGEISDTNWHHVTFVKVANEYGIYKDGTQVAYTQDNDTQTVTQPIAIGASISGGDAFSGHMDAVRIQKSNIFSASPVVGLSDTIIVPTSVPTSDANTKLLLNFEEGDQYGGHNLEPQANAHVDKDTKKWGDGAWSFDGTSDYIELPDSADWDMFASNLDDWTVDFWVKHTDHAGGENYLQHFNASAERWQIQHSDGNGLRFLARTGGSNVIDSGWAGEITDTNWHHIAVIKIADEYGMYKDGTQIHYVQDSSTVNITGPLVIGRDNTAPSSYFDGYMDEIRIQKSNSFSASPNVGLTDTISVPSSEYSEAKQNMTLISESNTAEAQPTNSRIVLFEEDVDTVAINTDLKAYISRDGGTTWTQATLTDEGDYGTGKRILSGEIDISGQPAGTSMDWKLTTLNTKNLKIHGVGLSWE